MSVNASTLVSLKATLFSIRIPSIHCCTSAGLLNKLVSSYVGRVSVNGEERAVDSGDRAWGRRAC